MKLEKIGENVNINPFDEKALNPFENGQDLDEDIVVTESDVKF